MYIITFVKRGEEMATLTVSRKKLLGYRSLQRAIDRAEPRDTIHIEAGIYDEELLIDKPVKLIGVGKEEVFLTRGVTVQTTGNVTFEHVTIGYNDATDYGIHIEQGNVSIKNCSVCENKFYGIFVEKYCRLNVRNSDIFKNGYGIKNDGFLQMRHCLLYENVSDAQLLVANHGEAQLQHTNIFRGNVAVRIDDHSRVEMKTCEIHTHLNRQIEVLQSSALKMATCELADGRDVGLYIEKSVADVHASSLLTHHEEQMIITQNSTVHIDDVVFRKGKWCGLSVQDSLVHVANSEFRENGANKKEAAVPQLYVTGKALVEVVRTTFTDGAGAGISLDQRAHALVKYSSFKNVQEIVRTNDDATVNMMASGESGTTKSSEQSIAATEETIVDQIDERILKAFTNKKPVKPNKYGTGDARQLDNQSAELKKVLHELDRYIGMDSVKKTIRDFVNVVGLTKMRKEQGMKVAEPVAPHIVFTGNPGTGKTTIARIIGKIYYHLGMLDSGHLVEVGREDLVGEYIGHSEKVTKEKIKEAMGGVLFIDEAYALSDGTGSSRDFGVKVIDTLLPALENHRGKFIAIVAGYPNEMERFLNTNPGLRNRFTEQIHFPDYTPEELLAIFKMMTVEKGFAINEAAEEVLLEELIRLYRTRDDNFGNARLVRGLVEAVERAQTARILKRGNTDWTDTTFTAEDVRYALSEDDDKVFDVPIDEEMLTDMLAQLDRLIGLDRVKEEIKKTVELMRYYKKDGREPTHLLNHTLLIGNPGTGKTEVGRILAGIYRALGLLERGELIEVDRNGLVDMYRGGTEKKTTEVIEGALESTLFIDEAYTLTNKDASDPGHTAVEILLKKMSDLEGQFLVIAAGYKEDMEQFLDSNAGLRRRFSKTYVFDDYTPDELVQITELHLDDYVLTEEAKTMLFRHFEKLYANRDRTFGNAGLARQLATQCMNALDYRMAQLDEKKMTQQLKRTIEVEDVKEAVASS